MNGLTILIDSNAISDYPGNKLPTAGMQFMNSVVDVIPNVSVISKTEILSFNAPPDSARLLRGFIQDSNLFWLTPDVVEVTISVRRKHKLKVPDAIIAATALVQGFTTQPVRLHEYSGLRLIDPHKL
jgi:hypothetical protein